MVTAAWLRSPEVTAREAVPACSSPAVGRTASASSARVAPLNSAMVRPPKVTASASGRRPAPPHTRHGPVTTKRRARSRICGLAESARVCRTWLRALQNRPL